MVSGTDGMIIPNNQLPDISSILGGLDIGAIGSNLTSGLQNIAGPAMGAVGGGIDPAASFFDSLPGDPSEYMNPVKVAGDDNMQNSLGEAQIARLDMLIAETERANYINTKLLQAARS